MTPEKPAKRNQIPPKAVEQLRQFTTARALARKAGVSKVHAYRLLELIGEKHPLQMKLIREKPTGPLSKAYRFKLAADRRRLRRQVA